MFKHSMLAMVTLAALSAPGPVRADAGTDPMLCEARRMRCDSKQLDCLVRCEHRAARRVGRPGDAATSAQTDCTSSCVERSKKAMDRIDQNPPCAVDPVTAEPETCEARLLRIGAVNLVCGSRCTSRAQANDAVDLDACLQACQTLCETAVEETQASPICAAGRVGTDPICGAQ